MKIRLSELRAIIRDVIQETLDDPKDLKGRSSELAAYVIDEPSFDKKTAVIYSPDSLKKFLESKSHIAVADKRGLADLVVGEDIVVGYIVIAKPPSKRTPCNGAWEVKFSVGPGAVVYGVGYALSPSGILMPDRRSVSARAVGGWLKQSGRANKTLDNVDAHDSSMDHPNHTDDTSDDCRMNDSGVDALNRSYEIIAGEREMLAVMMKRHNETMRWFDDESATPSAHVTPLLKAAGLLLFTTAS